MLAGVALLHSRTGHFVEPSCAAALLGIRRLAEWVQQQQQQQQGSVVEPDADADGLLQQVRHLLAEGVHVFWATGGALMDKELRAQVLEQGAQQLSAYATSD
jgi:D-serine dehydratase